jgi:hypothetical protein
MQALIPTVQLGVAIIVGKSTINCRDRQNGNANSMRCTPTGILHLKLNSGISAEEASRSCKGQGMIEAASL